MSIHDRIRIRVEQDGLCAWVAVEAGPGLTAESLHESLADAGVFSGIDAEVVAVVTTALASEAPNGLRGVQFT